MNWATSSGSPGASGCATRRANSTGAESGLSRSIVSVRKYCAVDLEVGAGDEQDAELDHVDVRRRLDDHVLGLLAEPRRRLVGPHAHRERRAGLRRERVGRVEVRRAAQDRVARDRRLGALLALLLLLLLLLTCVRRRRRLEPGARRRAPHPGRRRAVGGGAGVGGRAAVSGAHAPRSAPPVTRSPRSTPAARSPTVAAGSTPSSAREPLRPQLRPRAQQRLDRLELDGAEHERRRARRRGLAHEQGVHPREHRLAAREPARELGRPAVDHRDPVRRDEPHGSAVR